MSRIGIAISGGPNPAEMIGLVVLAESLGYESAWVAEGHARPVRDPGSMRDSDLPHPARH
jgi:alkanesulfonate monooxygenase SsuD/methylene tetrahydromethanopterin reductase-like flavin-dependent oxidoreductase (luciferase family)